MKAYLMTVVVVDYENMGQNAVKYHMEHPDYINPTVVSVREADIGEWSDDHPLNSYKTMYDAVKTYFPE